jgi:hypothetical protein
MLEKNFNSLVQREKPNWTMKLVHQDNFVINKLLSTITKKKSHRFEQMTTFCIETLTDVIAFIETGI